MGVSSAREKRGRRSSDERRSDSARSISRGYRSIRSRLDARPRVSQAISRAARTPFRRYSWRTGVRRDRGADYAVDQIRTRNFAAWSLCEARRSIAGHVNATLQSIETRERIESMKIPTVKNGPRQTLQRSIIRLKNFARAKLFGELLQCDYDELLA